LVDGGVTPEDLVGFGDEVRITLHGTLSRVIVPPGLNPRQLCQGQRDSVLLSLCVDGLTGTVSWQWLAGMHQEEMLRVLEHWNADGFDAVVWDNASSHLAATVQTWGMPLVQQPEYAPELNPAERVNEEIRRGLKGKTFRTLAEKMLAVEHQLSYWKAHPAIIQRLCGFPWIQACVALLDQVSPAAESQDFGNGMRQAA
jgi:hypothetical protein